MLRQMGFNRLAQIRQKSNPIINLVIRSFSLYNCKSPEREEVDRLTKIINLHPFPDEPLQPIFLKHAPPSVLTSKFVEDVLCCLFEAHSNGLKALEFFNYSLSHSKSSPTVEAFEQTLHILARMRYIHKAWELMECVKEKHPHLLTMKSMGILLCKIAKIRSYEETLEAFDRMEKEIFVGREFGTEAFNVLIRAFCMMRDMTEAKKVFDSMISRFPPNQKTFNILLLGFKETKDLTSTELFYQGMIVRGFEPNIVTYNVRIDALCKGAQLDEAVRIFQEMEQKKFPPSLATLTTLIHGAGIVRDPVKAREFFDGIESRGLKPDTAAYNAFMNSLIRCKEMKAAAKLMDEMGEKGVSLDNMTYHNLFFGMIKRKDSEGVFWLHDKMVERGFVPQSRTLGMLMRFFYSNWRVDLAWEFWRYVVGKGYCPHGSALDVLLAGLCSRGLVDEAFECSKEVMDRGRFLSRKAFLMVEKLLLRTDGGEDKLKILKQMANKIRADMSPPTVRGLE